VWLIVGIGQRCRIGVLHIPLPRLQIVELRLCLNCSRIDAFDGSFFDLENTIFQSGIAFCKTLQQSRRIGWRPDIVSFTGGQMGSRQRELTAHEQQHDERACSSESQRVHRSLSFIQWLSIRLRQCSVLRAGNQLSSRFLPCPQDPAGDSNLQYFPGSRAITKLSYRMKKCADSEASSRPQKSAKVRCKDHR
jgi:hypothetical protein